MWERIRATCLWLVLLLTFPGHAAPWSDIAEKAKGQTVHFYLWSGSPDALNYLHWAATTLQTRYQVELQVHPVNDLDQVIKQLTPKPGEAPHPTEIDLLWLNGLSFAHLRNHALLYGPLVEQLPNWSYVNQTLPVDKDASFPTLGLEAPWGMGQLVFIHDAKLLYNPPQNFSELLSYARAFPGRITYPRPPQFLGTQFLQALLIELTGNDPALQRPVDKANFADITAPLWRYLDDLHPYLWHQGMSFPPSGNAMIEMLAKKEIDLVPTFNPNMLYAAQSQGRLPLSTKVYAMDSGALTNIHYLAIPAQATAKEGALMTINFLLSPEAQSRKGMINIWGDLSVLRSESLSGALKHVPTYQAIESPAPSWANALNQAWLKRYGNRR
ncbi:ABC transporter substrate-binding protein [Vibrio porteresiae]|uniref:ABC transporter substrate-binding protein n=1 Tax=Vibrio porteresiae DSM 19223 TaxID=1123496 RepID=A0ABZ0Q8E2_9VIBR|nr:ABC transporter substrate-binding protein [Vibrio porteresiae]WPC72276.1 ABC transporter substrate-binding protein [Vibrio porteresiae DSM 19223]